MSSTLNEFSVHRTMGLSGSGSVSVSGGGGGGSSGVLANRIISDKKTKTSPSSSSSSMSSAAASSSRLGRDLRSYSSCGTPHTYTYHVMLLFLSLSVSYNTNIYDMHVYCMYTSNLSSSNPLFYALLSTLERIMRIKTIANIALLLCFLCSQMMMMGSTAQGCFCRWRIPLCGMASRSLWHSRISSARCRSCLSDPSVSYCTGNRTSSGNDDDTGVCCGGSSGGDSGSDGSINSK